MKRKNFFYALTIILAISACKKPDIKKALNFPETSYKTLESYDTTGKPANLLKDTISANLMYFIDTLLPAGRDAVKAHPEFFGDTINNDIVITRPSDVYMTFVSQGAGYKNSIGFYTYNTGQPPITPDDVKTITYAFPSAGNNTPLKAGDKIKLGKFNAGTTIGLVVMQGAWNPDTKSPDNDVLHFCTDAILNPEGSSSLTQHAVLVNYATENKLIFGFEDLARTLPNCDNDFNDVVFYCVVNP